jgi:hypothetical protein
MCPDDNTHHLEDTKNRPSKQGEKARKAKTCGWNLEEEYAKASKNGKSGGRVYPSELVAKDADNRPTYRGPNVQQPDDRRRLRAGQANSPPKVG